MRNAKYCVFWPSIRENYNIFRYQQVRIRFNLLVRVSDSPDRNVSFLTAPNTDDEINDAVGQSPVIVRMNFAHCAKVEGDVRNQTSNFSEAWKDERNDGAVECGDAKDSAQGRRLMKLLGFKSRFVLLNDSLHVWKDLLRPHRGDHARDRAAEKWIAEGRSELFQESASLGRTHSETLRCVG